jgi:hypothetical protein
VSSWLDPWAKRAATPDDDAAQAHPSATPIGPTAARPSRRDVLKKAALVGGLVWTVPVISTALAPAASASGGGLGLPCSPEGSTCTGGSVCFTGICGAPGAPCAGGCYSSTCGKGVCGGKNASCGGGVLCAPGLTCAKNGKCK